MLDFLPALPCKNQNCQILGSISFKKAVVSMCNLIWEFFFHLSVQMCEGGCINPDSRAQEVMGLIPASGTLRGLCSSATSGQEGVC